MNLTRRQFLLSGVSLAAFVGTGGWSWFAPETQVTGSIVGASSAIGHKLREGTFAEPTESVKAKIVIVGGGIAGLSAAWALQSAGLEDFILLDLEKEPGGNAMSGKNEVSAYPWGAHYVPLLTEESNAARALFEDLGIITGYEKGLPVYNDYYISSEPHERLFLHGRWQDGLVPTIGATERDKEQYAAFFGEMERYKHLKGSDGKRAFAIPLDKSSADKELRALDAVSMADYMRKHGWDSERLLWYVDYCCRDDYGATAEHVSAWAGIHYFAGRAGAAANADAQSVLTWPEGNGFIVHALAKRFGERIRTNALVYNVTKTDAGAQIRYWDAARDVTVKLEADAVILATPHFISERLYPTGMNLKPYSYSPWAVANITLRMQPKGKGAAPSWDNMIYKSELLGYVVATHQNLNHIQRETVITYYWPLSHLPPAEARREAYARSYDDWRDRILTELLRVHPELKGQVKHLDVWLWGHGMIRPEPDFIWKARQNTVGKAPVFYAHSDMSGISIFEEANHHGVQAAEALMRHFKHPFRSVV